MHIIYLVVLDYKIYHYENLICMMLWLKKYAPCTSTKTPLCRYSLLLFHFQFNISCLISSTIRVHMVLLYFTSCLNEIIHLSISFYIVTIETFVLLSL